MRTGLSDVTRVMSALVAAATIAACGGDDDDVTPPTPAISIALSSSALDITQGTNGMATVNLTRSGGFAGDVAIAVDGLPGTVTYASVPATIDGNASSAIITFDVGESATPGVINATVKATGTGVSAEMAPLAITVVAAPTYTLAVANAAVTATHRWNGNADRQHHEDWRLRRSCFAHGGRPSNRRDGSIRSGKRRRQLVDSDTHRRRQRGDR